MESDHDPILAELKEVNRELKRQNSPWHMLSRGVIYGIGFFVGSAIIATILLGIFGPYVAEISWVRAAYEQGSSLIGR